MSVFRATGAGVNSAFGGADNGQTGQKILQSTLSGKKPIRVAIVDDEEESRLLLQDILARSGEYECAGSYSSGEEAIREIPAAKPTIVLMDIRMPGISGIGCMRLLKALLPGLIVVLVSGMVDAETVSMALEAGGDSYLTKPFTVAQCLATLTFALRYRDHGVRDTDGVHTLSTKQHSQRAELTEREKAVMNGLSEGRLYKEIADKLGISYSAVHKHQQKIFKKLHVNNRTEATKRWSGSHGA